MALNNKIYECRKRLGISQQELAMRIGVSRQAISKWELAETEPELSKLKALAECFDVSVDYLLNDEDEVVKQTTNTSNLPNSIAKLVKRCGWLVGAYIAYCGIGLLIFAFISNALANLSMATIDGTLSFTSIFYHPYSPFFYIFMFLGIIGLIILTIGILLALYLKKKAR